MQRSKNSHLVKQAFSAVLLFSIALAASGAEQMMRARPAPTTASSTTVAPAGIPSVVQPPGQPTAPMPSKMLPPPPQGGGMAQLNSAAACGLNTTPRIANINGTQFGIEFQPGSQLNITGCGFGKGGQVYLSGGGTTTVQLKIDSWSDSNIHAHIDASLGGVPDLDGVKVNIKPNGLPLMSSIETNKFKAARVQFALAIPTTAAGKYSQIYGPPKTINTGSYSQINDAPAASSKGEVAGSVAITPKARTSVLSMSVFTRVSRTTVYSGFCPAATDQQSQMTDSWPVDFLANGFEVVGVNYTNQTLQTNWDTQKVQWVLVGGSPGIPRYDAMQKRIFVTFQANSMYVKKAGAIEIVADLAAFPTNLVHDLETGGHSACTSAYTVSLTVSGPRGYSPLK